MSELGDRHYCPAAIAPCGYAPATAPLIPPVAPSAHRSVAPAAFRRHGRTPRPPHAAAARHTPDIRRAAPRNRCNASSPPPSPAHTSGSSSSRPRVPPPASTPSPRLPFPAGVPRRCAARSPPPRRTVDRVGRSIARIQPTPRPAPVAWAERDGRVRMLLASRPSAPLGSRLVLPRVHPSQHRVHIFLRQSHTRRPARRIPLAQPV